MVVALAYWRKPLIYATHKKAVFSTSGHCQCALARKALLWLSYACVCVVRIPWNSKMFFWFSSGRIRVRSILSIDRLSSIAELYGVCLCVSFEKSLNYYGYMYIQWDATRIEYDVIGMLPNSFFPIFASIGLHEGCPFILCLGSVFKGFSNTYLILLGSSGNLGV